MICVTYNVDIEAYLLDVDETGYVWTYLDDARDPSVIVPGAVVVAGDDDAAAVCRVVDLIERADHTLVHLEPLPGSVEQFVALAQRQLIA